MGVEDNITAAETLLDFNQAHLQTWAKLVKSNGDLGVLLFVLVVLRQGHLASWQVINFTFGTVGSQAVSGGGAGLLPDVAQDEVLDGLVLGEVWNFLVVDKLFDASVNGALASTHSVMSEFNERALVRGRFFTISSLFVYDVEKHDALAGRQVHALHLDRGEHRLDHQRGKL